MQVSKKSSNFAPILTKHTIMDNNLIEQLRAICNAEKITAEQKQLVLSTCKDLGITVAKTNCKSCIFDAAVQCYNALVKQEREKAGADAVAENDTGAQYVLRDGVDVLFGGLRINAATINDELAHAIVARGFSLRWFAKYPEQ